MFKRSVAVVLGTFICIASSAANAGVIPGTAFVPNQPFAFSTQTPTTSCLALGPIANASNTSNGSARFQTLALGTPPVVA
jgi:hypothetical protein